MSDSLCLAGPRSAIALAGDLALAREAAPLYAAWPRAGPDGSAAAAVPPSGLDLSREGKDWRLSPRGAAVESQSFAQGYEACNGLIGGLIGEYVVQDPGLVSVHAAAALTGAGVLVAVADAFAGKSTLATALAWQDCPLVCDDRVVIVAGPPVQARALGLAAKMRLPLPDDLPPSFREFIGAATLPHWPGIAALALDGRHQCPFGREAPVAAWLLPARDPARTGVDLEPVERAAVVRALAEQTFAPHLPVADLLRRCATLAEAAPCYRLRYAASAEAAGWLADRFGRPA